jgi:hypothetical protein
MYYIHSIRNIQLLDLEHAMMIFKRDLQPHTKLTKTVVTTHKTSRNGKQKMNGSDLTAVLHNANRIGAGLRTNKRLPINDPVTITMAFSDRDGVKGQETLSGKVQWVRNYTNRGTKGYLLGVAWDLIPTKESNPWLYDYLDITLRSY